MQRACLDVTLELRLLSGVDVCQLMDEQEFEVMEEREFSSGDIFLLGDCSQNDIYSICV